MRKLFLAIAAILSMAATAAAQTTLVTGTVKDLNGVAYAGGTIKAQLVLAGAGVNGTPTVTVTGVQACASSGFGSSPCQVPFSGTDGPVNLDSTGSFSMALQSNNLVTPSGTQWLFSVTSQGAPPPLGTGPQACTATITITGAAQSVSSNFSACPALGNGGGSSFGSAITYLSPNCSGTVAPCISIPPTGGQFNGAITNNGSGVVTFVSGFPSPTPIVGQLAWVQVEPNNCDTHFNSFLVANSWAEVLYAGAAHSAGGTPITITAVNPGTSITLSTTNVATQGGANACLFYGPNIYAQLNQACQNGVTVLVATGTYVVDNTANGTHSACGDIQLTTLTPTFPVALTGQGIDSTVLRTPPWYNHEGDLGTVVAVAQLSYITIDGTWTAVNTINGRGTPWDASACQSHDFSIRGYNFGASAASENLYPGQGQGPIVGNCEIRNMYMAGANVGMGACLGRLNIIDSTVISRGTTYALYGGANNNCILNIIGGYHQSSGAVQVAGQDPGVWGRQSAQSPTGDSLWVTNAELCVTTGSTAPAINAQEGSGEVRLVNVKINTSPYCAGAVGANAGAVTLTSGVTLRATQTSFGANGAGNTVNNPAGATFFDGVNNSFSGGAGYTGAGTLIADSHSVKGSCTGTATASSTLGLYGTGPNATTTACNSATIGTGIVVIGPRTLFALNCTATAAGNTASDVCIVLQNGANVGSCSLNGVTTCTAALNVALADTDRISLEITSGVASTLAGVKAIADWN
jgi:hypothetical protein